MTYNLSREFQFSLLFAKKYATHTHTYISIYTVSLRKQIQTFLLSTLEIHSHENFIPLEILAHFDITPNY